MKTPILPEANNSMIWAFIGSPWGVFFCYLLVINVITFLIFGWDKFKAKWKANHEASRRVPEKTLMTLAALGGSVGALLGMRCFHHKTLHKKFTIGVPLLLFAWILIPAGLYLYWQFIR